VYSVALEMFLDGGEDDDVVKYSEIVVGVMFLTFDNPSTALKSARVESCGLERLCRNVFGDEVGSAAT